MTGKDFGRASCGAHRHVPAAWEILPNRLDHPSTQSAVSVVQNTPGEQVDTTYPGAVALKPVRTAI
jgi:hypothetical protein